MRIGMVISVLERPMAGRLAAGRGLLCAAVLTAGAGCATEAMTGADQPATVEALEPFSQVLPGSVAGFDMVPVRAEGAAPFWIGRTEVTWDLYDIFVYRLDEAAGAEGGVDAVTRPSKPYLPPDRGFGHEGYPAMGMSHHAAGEFCKWLSAKTGRRYRLPTEAEWEIACAADGGGALSPEGLGDAAWFGANADNKTHPIAEKAAGALGLHDMAGNVAEWCTGREGKPVARGGSYRDSADAVGCGARLLPSPAWNASDPQIPKSRWWLADCSFVGFRVVCEPVDTIEREKAGHEE